MGEKAMKRCPDCGYKGDLKSHSAKHLLDGVVSVDVNEYSCPQCKAVHRGFLKIEVLYGKIAHELSGLSRLLRPDELKWLRKYLGYSTTTWAEYLSVSRETVSRWENARTPIPLSTERLLRMMARLGPHIHEYGTPEQFLKNDSKKEPLELKQNS
ncbi:hypothetical protein KAI87_10485, partial [Myxococcota bacterium]|nr:hypothetical protein [Myxococcota bacterium]